MKKGHRRVWSMSVTPQLSSRTRYQPLTQSSNQSPSGKAKQVGRYETYRGLLPPVMPSSKVGELFVSLRTGHGRDGPKRESQDVYFDQVNGPARLLGVADGHGPQGQRVAAFIAQKLPLMLFQRNIKKDVESFSHALTLSLIDCNIQLKDSEIEVENSGTTCLSLLISGNLISCCNVGDSRAILGRCMRGAWSVHQLSWDHKPENPQELMRIVGAGGSVSPSKGRSGSYRVYGSGGKSPGLTMSRVVGHRKAEAVGVVCEPEVQSVTLSAADKFIIVATDGLWHVMTSIEVVKLASTFYQMNASSVAEALVSEAERRWGLQGTYMDDITVLFLPILLST